MNNWPVIIENIAWFTDRELSQRGMSRIIGVSPGAISKLLRRVRETNSLTQGVLWHLLKTITSKEDQALLCNNFRLIQPQRRITNSGLRTVSYLGTKLWNDNLALFVDTIDGDFCTCKSSLKYRWHDHKGNWFSVRVMNIFEFYISVDVPLQRIF